MKLLPRPLFVAGTALYCTVLLAQPPVSASKPDPVSAPPASANSSVQVASPTAEQTAAVGAVAATAAAPAAVPAMPAGAQPWLYEAVQIGPLRQVYEQNNFQPLWTADKAKQAVELINKAGEDGLTASSYRPDELAQLVQSDNLQALELAASRQFFKFVSDLTTGRVNPSSVGAEVDFRAHVASLPQRFYQLLSADNLATALDEIRPHAFGYSQLKALLNGGAGAAASEPQAQASHNLPPLPSKLSPYGRWAGVPQLALQLVESGDLPSTQARAYIDNTRYDDNLIAAVERFQRRKGLTPDGVIGPQTYRALTGGQAAVQAITPQVKETIKLNMERLRWLDHSIASERYIWVNLPAFRLQAYDRGSRFGEPALDMATVIGKGGRYGTPIKAKAMTSVVFSPYWNVPPSIAKQEYWPKQRANPDFLASQNMEVTKNGGIRQRPGPRNALGRVKFMLPNDDAIYLHDTPSKHLFSRSERAFSHGCVRVQQPERLAQFVMAGQMSDSQIRQAMQAGRERHVAVRDKIPVILMYATASVNSSGQLVLHKDLYGLDDALKRALAAR